MLIKAPIRGADKYRYYKSVFWDSNDKKHNGVDYACAPGSTIFSLTGGTVTKIGYPYGDDLSFRYVQVTDADGNDIRYFYVSPSAVMGELIDIGDELGQLQDLGLRYPGITSHVHFEVVTCRSPKTFVDPEIYLKSLEN